MTAVGAKHSGSPLNILSNKLSAGMLRPYNILSNKLSAVMLRPYRYIRCICRYTIRFLKDLLQNS